MRPAGGQLTESVENARLGKMSEVIVTDCTRLVTCGSARDQWGETCRYSWCWYMVDPTTGGGAGGSVFWTGRTTRTIVLLLAAI